MSLRILPVALALLLLAAASARGETPASTAIRPDGSSGAAALEAPGSPGEPVAVRVAAGLNAATNLAFGPDGTLYFGEWKTGAVYPIGPDGRPVRYGTPVIDVGEPAWGNERGFIGLAVGPDGEFYTFTTYAKPGGGWFNRLSRWDAGVETPLLDNLDAGDWHNAGRIQVDARDGTLWVAYGDVNKYAVAQDPTDLRGSILHMTRDAKPVAGNVAADSLVWSYGHRQPFGFAVDPVSGRVMVAENMDKKNDEVSLVAPGGNHGWPLCEGPCVPARDGFIDPVLYYPETIGPTSGAYLGGHFYFGDFNHGQVHRVHRGADGGWADEIVYKHPRAPILDLKPGPEGNTLYFSTWSDIWKLTFPNVVPTNGTDPFPNATRPPPNGTFGPPTGPTGPSDGPAPRPTPAWGAIGVVATFALAGLARRLPR
ncbi:MAG TPA: PQQ-dependent sugar dehydrogenase [Candidatus Thermoplasmatota archaeon]|nr:PQQ-dependent sugar dehydrogenase [Candidatus Thermoplasmatota archaeon]